MGLVASGLIVSGCSTSGSLTDAEREKLDPALQALVLDEGMAAFTYSAAEAPGRVVTYEVIIRSSRADALREHVAVANTQWVRVDVFDVLGRRVQALFDGMLHADRTEAFTLDGADLPSGLYVVRVMGEPFQAVRTV